MRKPNTAHAAPEAQDLRQRAARARDAAGRFIRRAAGHASATDRAGQDPALAVTAVFDATWEALGKALDAEVPDDLIEELQAAEGAAYDRLRTVRPTTPAGYRALAEAWSTVLEGECGGEPGVTHADHAADSLIAGARACAPVSASGSHPDAALLALGAEFVVAWTAEEEAPDGAGYWACNCLAQQIVQAPAVTVAGLGIKALLLARLDEDDSSPRNPARAQGPIASHWNVLRQVQEGAARLATSPDMGIPMSSAAGPETGFPAAGSDAGDRLPAPRHDLSALSIAELARLHSAIVHAEEAMGSAENRPCFSGDSRFGLTPAGWIINREAARLSQFLAAIAEEVGRRTPVEDNEREERLNTLVAHAVLAGGLGEHPKLIAEINATWGSAR